MVIGDLVAVLGLNSSEFRRGMKHARSDLGSFDKAAARTRQILSGLFAGASVAGLTAYAQRTIDATDQLGKLAIRLRATTEELSELQFVAERSGVATNTLNMGLQRMQRRLGEVASTGKGAAAPALERLGLDAEKLVQLPLSEQFETIADRLASVENAGERTALAMRFFDSEGVALLQTMEGGAAGIRAMRDEARALGVTITQNMADSAAEANDRMTNLQARLNGVGREILFTVAPAFSDFLDYVGRTVAPVVNGATAAFNKLLEGVRLAAAGLLIAVRRVMQGYRSVREMILGESPELNAAIDGLQGAIDGLFASAAQNADAASVAVERFKASVRGAAQAGAAGAVSAPAAGAGAGAAAAAGGPMTVDQIAAMLDGIKSQAKTAGQIVDDALSVDRMPNLERLRDGIADSIVAGAREGSSGMRDTFVSALNRMAADLLRSQVLDLLSKLPGLGGGDSTGGGGNVFASLFAGFFATGGHIPAGQFGVVGERGPELVTGPANVTPMTGGAVVNVIDQRGANAPPVQIQRGAFNGREEIRVLIEDSVLEIMSSRQGRQIAAMHSGRGAR